MLLVIISRKIVESFAAIKCYKDDNEEQFHRDYKFWSQEGTGNKQYKFWSQEGTSNKQFVAEGSPLVPWGCLDQTNRNIT